MKTHPGFGVASALFAAVLAVPALPAASEDRQSLQVVRTVEPTFPADQLLYGTTRGRARLVISVDVNGRLEDWIVTGYSKASFARAAVDAVKRWEFRPMRLHGTPVASRAELFFNFEATGVVVSLDAGSFTERRLSDMMERDDYAICTLQELDRIPAPVAMDTPAYPVQLRDRGISGEALIEFYIDESGSVRIPAVISASFDELGALAASAVQNWRFEPPTRNGKPVLVQARQLFHFSEKGT